MTVLMNTDIQNTRTLFPNIAAQKVFVRGSFTEKVSCDITANNLSRPVLIAFNSKNEMVVGTDGYSYDNNILLMSPKKKNAKRGYYRKKMQKQFRTRTYNRRQLVESGFGAMKRTEGSSVSSKKAKTIRAELYCKMVTYNLFYCLFRLLGQSQISKNIYKL